MALRRSQLAGFPSVRMRRLRRTDVLRKMVRETRLSPDMLIFPIFVEEGIHERTPVASMPGQYRWPVHALPSLLRELRGLDIPSVILFGIPAWKDETGSSAFAQDGVVQHAIRAAKDAVPEMIVITDTCLDEYTSHGHCGILRNGDVDNDATLEVLARVAVSQAEAGSDIVAPSDMMDGRVATIRASLDRSGYENTPIMAYSAKFASAFYGPFREAVDCAPQFGDRRSYQMDGGNRREAQREITLDIQEGADIVMVKPALAYLDIIRDVRESCQAPIAAYNVSGEYAMVKAAAAQDWIDETLVTMEILTSIARAGADLIITYHACEAARELQR